MLFGNKKCPQCGSSYDVVESTCPNCHTPDRNFDSLRVSKDYVWLPVYKQVTLFVFGFGLLTLLSMLAKSIFGLFMDPESTGFALTVNYIRYVLTAAAMAVLLIHNYHNFKPTMKRWYSYLIGIVVGVATILVTLGYNTMINLIHPMGTNANQTLANNMIHDFPVLSLFLLVIIGPTVEEMTYRVGLFTVLARVHKAVAYIVSIVVFAFIHFDISATGDALVNEFLSLPVYVFTGGLLCFAYDTFGLPASLTAHVLNNFISTLPIIFAVIGGK